MTNPFGEGGFDMNSLLQQAQAMQEQLVSAQQQLEHERVEGTVGSVTVTVTGTGELAGVQIDAGYHDAHDEESLADLGDMIVAAYRVARTQAESIAQQAMNPLAGLGDALGGGDLGALFGGGDAGQSGDARPAGFSLPARDDAETDSADEHADEQRPGGSQGV
ncbi:YbaB/EbfC family nucleoid-associated protein [Nocardioides massiliensis]|uniref:Nucleoid-associated protein J2S59_000816 n=1 Tax=Nocardioides massiliensis TaxID=1325935 RepID=A0ABT9NKQ4_9ACTN|nr:YbaB/EbfC family nucleoid-associated protein [Nocardioides massiliensis]MDP9821007.1 DNA-binding protein YbaB [Nocardioides massiliensis]